MTVEYLHAPSADLPEAGQSSSISNLMYMIWRSRPDLQQHFDLSRDDGRQRFRSWFEGSGPSEYGLTVAEAGVREFREPTPRGSTNAGRGFLTSLFGKAKPAPVEEPVVRPEQGATLVGYAHGILGMGEHVRMTAEALAKADVPCGIFDFDMGVKNKQADEGAYPLVDGNRFRANLFHVNADQMLYTYCKLRPDFFRDRYNIGFWAWELSRCPAAWAPITNMVDEIWAPSTFVRDAFSAVTSRPVIHMPLCVELPPFRRRPRSYFGLPDGDCLFLFVFDFHSFIDRKNPLAAIRAFVRAFPSRSVRAGLVVKVMNGDTDHPVWRSMMKLIDGDPRIHVVNEVMTRQDVLALVDCCDAFVSLHRAEGFGRGPAEAMYLGKPVIVTNYSGNTDFTREGAALLLNYDLVPISPDQYICPEGQVWASVDEEQAAAMMRQVFGGGPEIEEIAARGQDIVKTEFSAAAVGRKMKKRLRTVGAIDD